MELLRLPVRDPVIRDGAYDTRVERDACHGAFWITQVRNPGDSLDHETDTDELIYLDENAARAVYLTLKNHFEA